MGPESPSGIADSDECGIYPEICSDGRQVPPSSRLISTGGAYDMDFFFIDIDKRTSYAIGSDCGYTAADSVLPGDWVRPVEEAMCGLLGYVVAPDTLYVLDDNGDLIIIQHEHSNVYLPGEGHVVLNPAALQSTTPDAGELARYRQSTHPLLLRLVLPVPSPAVWLGDRVVVTDGEHTGKSGLITEIRLYDAATEKTYYSEVQRLDWDHSSPACPIYAPVSALARHAFDSLYQFLLFDRVRVVFDPLYGGAVGRVVDVCGFDITVSVAATLPLAGPTVPCNVLLGRRSFVVRADSSRREWRIGDIFLVRFGEHAGARATAVKGGKANVIELVETSPPRLTFTAKFSDLEFDFHPHVPQPIMTIGQPIDFPNLFDRSCLKRMKRGQRFEGIDVQIMRGVHKGFRGSVIGDYDSESRARRMDWQEDPNPTDFAGILLSIRELGSNRVITGVRVEDVYHAGSMLDINAAIQLPPSIFLGSRAPSKLPPVVGLFRTIPERRNATPPPDDNAGDLWPSPTIMDALIGEFTGMWMCSPAFAGKKIDVRIQGVHQLKTKVAKRILNLEGRAGWILLETAVDPGVPKLPVSNVGVNWTRHLVHRNCIRPRRDDDEGRCISVTTHRVIVVGPDIHGDTANLGCYAVPIPTWPHTFGNGVVCVRFEDGSEGIIPVAGLCSSKNDEIRTDTYTFLCSEFV
ncbi:hypothetical protein B0H14DRAFT_2595865 [Mycena olivaceomarginata]|nr:hypothetical protein B0H14DRAFT_2595865 [Mycena olivaceomarginata]